MSKKIKIAIPTDDGETIVRQFGVSRGFLVLTVDDSGILAREMRWNLLSAILTSDLGSHYNLFDCDAVLVNEIGSCQYRHLEAEKIKILRTSQKLIEKAVNAYLRSQMSLEIAEV